MHCDLIVLSVLSSVLSSPLDGMGMCSLSAKLVQLLHYINN